MKKLIFISFLLVAFLQTKADHNAGGEITWTCLKTGTDKGKYVFKLTLYRYCSGIPLTSSAILTSNSAATNIAMTRVTQRSIAPTTYTSCSNRLFDCNGLNNEGAIEMHVYESMPTLIGGVPPGMGWTFSWNSCCRSAPQIYSKGDLTDNLHPQNQSFRITSVMYPVPGQKSGECSDSSPRFIEGPLTVACTKNNYDILTNAIDDEGDRLEYSFTSLVTSNGNPVTYASHLNTPQTVPRPDGGNFIVPSPGFSANQPMPWSTSNLDTLNQPAEIDSVTGNFSFLSYNRGQYALGTRVEAYNKDGYKTASIMRDAVLLLIDCDSLPFGAGPNTPPQFSFNSTKKGLVLNNYVDTIKIGELLDLDVTARDSQLADTNLLQSIRLEAFGGSLDHIYTNGATFCSNNCAKLDTSSNSWNGGAKYFMDSIQLGTTLEWTPQCNNLQDACGDYQSSRTYEFYFKAYDNACGASGITYATATITVVGDPSLQVEIDSLAQQMNNQIFVRWQPAVSAGFIGYHLYRANNSKGPYQLLTTINNVTTTTFNDTSAAQDSTYYYYVALDALDAPQCVGSDIYGNLNLQLSKPLSGSVELNWNNVLPLDSGNAYYEVYRLDSNQNEVLLANVGGNLSYNDTSLFCFDSLTYFVKAYVNGVPFSTSLLKSIQPNNVFNQQVTITQLVVDSSGQVTLSWDSGSFNSSSFRKYFIHVATDSVGPFTVVDSISNIQQLTYLHTTARADTTEKFYFVRVLGYSDCLMGEVMSKRSNIVSSLQLNIANMKNGNLSLTWSPFVNLRSKSTGGQYFIYRKYAGEPWLLIDSTVYGQELYQDSILLCNTSVDYKVDVDSIGSMVSVWNSYNIPASYEGDLILTNGNELRGPAGINYSWFKDGNAYPQAGNDSAFIPTENGSYRLEVLLANGCEVITNTIDVTTVGIENTLENRAIVVFPNPNDGQFNVLISLSKGEDALIRMLNYQGKIVYEKQLVGTVTTAPVKLDIDAKGLSSGIYLMNITIGNENYTRKVMFK